MAGWLHGARSVLPQPEGDLGKRLEFACAEAFSRDVGGVILVGTDCPTLDAGRLMILHSHVAAGRFVLQPALDGGYVAFGLPFLLPSVFHDIAWGTETVCAQTTSALRDAGQFPTILDPLRDVDTQDDWDAVHSDLLHHPTFNAPEFTP